MNLLQRAAIIATIALSVSHASPGFTGDASHSPKEHIVEITGFKYIPDKLEINAGDTVTLINKDIAPHTATADDTTFDTGKLNLNESGSITFTNAQVISYYCIYHPMMKASMQVR